jgi:hypothetical protein
MCDVAVTQRDARARRKVARLTIPRQSLRAASWPTASM